MRFQSVQYRPDSKEASFLSVLYGFWFSGESFSAAGLNLHSGSDRSFRLVSKPDAIPKGCATDIGTCYAVAERPMPASSDLHSEQLVITEADEVIDVRGFLLRMVGDPKRRSGLPGVDDAIRISECRDFFPKAVTGDCFLLPGIVINDCCGILCVLSFQKTESGVRFYLTRLEDTYEGERVLIRYPILRPKK